jgi:glycosyltransferase involved in cell wall biosynthesis
MQENKISLVIPAYNEEKYIGACLEHALKNGGKNLFEIIVIDNASTDQTKLVAEKYPGVKVIRENTKGLTYARQRGLLEARGDILAYIDADTRMPEGWAKIVLEEFGKNLDLACLSGPYKYYDLPLWEQFLVKIYWYILAYPLYLIFGYMAIGGNFAIRKTVLEKMNGFDTSIQFYGEDTNIARRAHKFGKVKFKTSFFMNTSGRRLDGQGLFKTAIIYSVNFFSEAVMRRPVTKKYTDIR